MKLDIISDTHFEFDNHPSVELIRNALALPEGGTRAPMIVVAGDISTFLNKESKSCISLFFNELKELYGADNIVYVLGNHDYWYQSVNEANARWEEITGIAPLNYNTVTKHGITFYGGTCWVKVTNPVDQIMMQSALNDFKFIRGYTHDFRNDAANRFYNDVKSRDTKAVIVSHHPPSHRCVYRRSIYDLPGMANDFDDLFDTNGNVKAWIYGHEHDGHDCEINGIPVYCNPRGYYMHNKPFELKQIEV